MNLLNRLYQIQTDVNQLIGEFQSIFGGTTRSTTTRTVRNRSTRRNYQGSNVNRGNVAPINTGGRHLTAAARKKMSLAAKQRWANRQKVA